MRAAIAVLILFTALSQAAAVESASEWSADMRSRIRLLAAGEIRAGEVGAYVEIALEPGFKTYWRTPGEAGVPPEFDFSQSENLASAEVLYPAPQAFEDGGGMSLGYHDDVLLPVRVTPADPAKPVILRLTLNYGVCEKICIPATGSAELVLGAAPDPDIAKSMEAAFAAVPQTFVGKGEDGEPLRILSIEPIAVDAAPGAPEQKLRLTIAGQTRALFAEGPARWYLEASAPSAAPEGATITVSLYGPRRAPWLSPCPLRFTIIGADAKVERAVTLDGCGRQP